MQESPLKSLTPLYSIQPTFHILLTIMIIIIIIITRILTFIKKKKKKKQEFYNLHVKYIPYKLFFHLKDNREILNYLSQ
jgi:uncharacterized membrane protein affecting hemolysin expression